MFIRKYWLPVTVFIVALAGVGLHYLQTRPPKDPIVIVKPVEPLEKPTAETPVGETSQGGHVHEDGDPWHAETHETPVENPSIVEKKLEPIEPPAYIYDPDAKERPDGWDPDLVYETGHGKIIDLNYRPLTEEEQAEYERLKATENPEHYGDKWEMGLRIIAIANIYRRNTPAFLDSLDADIAAGKSSEEIDAKIREFSDIFAD